MLRLTIPLSAHKVLLSRLKAKWTAEDVSDLVHRVLAVYAPTSALSRHTDHFSFDVRRQRFSHFASVSFDDAALAKAFAAGVAPYLSGAVAAAEDAHPDDITAAKRGVVAFEVRDRSTVTVDQLADDVVNALHGQTPCSTDDDTAVSLLELHRNAMSTCGTTGSHRLHRVSATARRLVAQRFSASGSTEVDLATVAINPDTLWRNEKRT